MATTTSGAFDEFANRIALTDNQKVRVKTRRDRTETYLKENFPPSSDVPLASVRLMGSARRGTSIRPLDDIDVLAKFKNKDGVFEQYRANSQDFLYRVRSVLNANTTVKQVGTRGQAVRLFYTDGLHVDIAPVFGWSSGGYALPAGDGSWLTTDPPKQEAWINERNQALGGYLKRRVRFIKRWNAVHSRRLGSWHLEVMMATAFTSMGRDCRDALKKFFDWAPSYVSVQDPDGHGGDLSLSLTWTAQAAIRRSFEASHERAVRANAAEADGDHREAIRLWAIILGDDFPSYTGS